MKKLIGAVVLGMAMAGNTVAASDLMGSATRICGNMKQVGGLTYLMVYRHNAGVYEAQERILDLLDSRNPMLNNIVRHVVQSVHPVAESMARSDKDLNIGPNEAPFDDLGYTTCMVWMMERM